MAGNSKRGAKVISMGKEKVVVEVADPSRHRPGASGRLAGVSILPPFTIGIVPGGCVDNKKGDIGTDVGADAGVDGNRYQRHVHILS